VGSRLCKVASIMLQPKFFFPTSLRPRRGRPPYNTTGATNFIFFFAQPLEASL